MNFSEVKLKYIAQLNPSKSELNINNIASQIVSFLPMDKILGPNELDLSMIKSVEEVYSGYTYFKEDDIVLAKVTPCFENGNLAIAKDLTNGIGFGTTELHVLRVNEKLYDVKFIYYCLQTEEFKSEAVANMYGVGGLKRIPTEFLGEYKFLVPELDVQIKISDYLDLKLNQITNLIKNKTRLIRLLEQQRQSIITEAVTKGLNPNVKMKDSDIEWIGEIPEHWDVTKIKYNTYVKGRIGWQGLKSDEFVDKGPFLVTGTDFKNGYVEWSTCYHISEERYEEAPPIQLRENDLLITKDGTIGKLAIVKEMPDKAILNSGIFVTRPINNKYLSKYMYWLLSSNVFDKYISLMETGSTIKHLYQETFVNFSFPIPSLKEQQEIVEYLNVKISEIDNIDYLVKEQILKLKEYRQALIYEAVTGKIDVCNLELD